MENKTVLTFDQAVNDLNDFILTNTPFTDANISGSGISAIRDILAHNTQRSALLAKFTANELSAASAQLRSSLISLGVSRGIHIPGNSSASINIECTLKIKTTSSAIYNSTSIFLRRGTTFKGSNVSTDNRVFTVLTPHRLLKTENTSDGYSIFKGVITAFEGTLNSYRFYVDATIDNQRFIMNSIKMDSQHTKVYYLSSDATSLISEFININNTELGILVPKANLFKIINHSENTTEFIFPAETLSPNRVIKIDYLSSIGSHGNGTNIVTGFANHGIPGEDIDAKVFTVIQPSSNGSDAPDNDHIRELIINHVPMQNRIVTKSDVNNAIKLKWPAMTDISVWSGKENTDPTFGVVYCSAKGMVNKSISYPISEIITEYLTNKSVDGLDIQFIRPQEILVNNDINVVLDKKLLTNESEIETISKIEQVFQDSFMKHSINFNGNIDHTAYNVDLKKLIPSLISTQFNHVYIIGVHHNNIYFDNEISKVVVKNLKYLNNKQVELKHDSLGKLYVYIRNKKIVNDIVGTVDFKSGIIKIQRPDLLIMNNNTIVEIIASNPTVRVKRNNFLKPNDINVKVIYG